MGFLRDSREVAGEERVADVFAGGDVLGNKETSGTDVELGAWLDGRPVEPRNREVFAGRSDADRMTFALKGANHVEREEHDRSIEAAVITKVALMVAIETVKGDECFEDARFRHSAA